MAEKGIGQVVLRISVADAVESVGLLKEDDSVGGAQWSSSSLSCYVSSQ